MKKELTIGLLGAPLNSTNLGCLALTFSLLKLLNEIEDESDFSFKYVVFESDPDIDAKKRCCNTIGVSEEKIKLIKAYAIHIKRSYVKHLHHNLSMIRAIKKCDLVIDITAGDSFTDIYGKNRFNSTTFVKQLVEFLHIPFVLGPQTYGPFESSWAIEKAGRVIRRANLVFSRDTISAQVVKEIASTQAIVTTDLAFQLPYKYNNNRNGSTKKTLVGFNISGLLLNNPTETATERAFSLRTNYDQYVKDVVDYLNSQEKYEIYLIPHVEEDLKAIQMFHDLYPGTRIVDVFKNPVDIKNCISGMDIFIGSRMHATIAAFSSGVVTIPVAYSRKFDGVFNLIEYEFTVDLQSLSTEEAVNKTIRYIEERAMLQEGLHVSQKKAKLFGDITKNKLKEFIENL